MDIVKRLKQDHEAIKADYGYSDNDYPLLKQAAEEIERLRRVEEQHERLKKAAKELIKDFSGNAILSAMVWDIEIALEKK